MIPSLSPSCTGPHDMQQQLPVKSPVPENEEERLLAVRRSELLDSDADDPTFDRFASLAKRLFNVPIALITLVDDDRQWFKANIGLDGVTETCRDVAFCAYAVMPDAPDVFIVRDATKDPRFQNNPLVTGSPFIRFYAGASLILDDVKVGSLCIVDTIPRDNFSQNEELNLLDLGSAVSMLIAERKEKAVMKNKKNAELMVDMMRSMLSSVVDTNNATKKLLEEYIENRASFESAKRRDNEYRILSGNNSKMNSVRKRETLLKDDETNYSRRSSINYTTQLNDSEIYRNYSTDEVFGNWSSVGISKSEEDLGSTSRGNSVEVKSAQKTQKRNSILSLNSLRKIPSLSEMKIPKDKNPMQNNEMSLTNLSEAVGHLKLSFESNMTLGYLVLEKSGLSYAPSASYLCCDVLQVIDGTRSIISEIEKSVRITWDIDRKTFSNTPQFTSPKVLHFILLRMMEKNVSKWRKINVVISFRSTGNKKYSSLSNHLESEEENEVHDWISGVIDLKITLSDRINNESNTKNDDDNKSNKNEAESNNIVTGENSVDDRNGFCANFSTFAVEQVILEAEGRFEKTNDENLDSENFGDENFNCWLPCCILENKNQMNENFKDDSGINDNSCNIDDGNVRGGREGGGEDDKLSGKCDEQRQGNHGGAENGRKERGEYEERERVEIGNRNNFVKSGTLRRRESFGIADISQNHSNNSSNGNMTSIYTSVSTDTDAHTYVSGVSQTFSEGSKLPSILPLRKFRRDDRESCEYDDGAISGSDAETIESDTNLSNLLNKLNIGGDTGRNNNDNYEKDNEKDVMKEGRRRWRRGSACSDVSINSDEDVERKRRIRERERLSLEKKKSEETKLSSNVHILAALSESDINSPTKSRTNSPKSQAKSRDIDTIYSLPPIASISKDLAGISRSRVSRRLYQHVGENDESSSAFKSTDLEDSIGDFKSSEGLYNENHSIRFQRFGTQKERDKETNESETNYWSNCSKEDDHVENYTGNDGNEELRQNDNGVGEKMKKVSKKEREKEKEREMIQGRARERNRSSRGEEKHSDIASEAQTEDTPRYSERKKRTPLAAIPSSPSISSLVSAVLNKEIREKKLIGELNPTAWTEIRTPSHKRLSNKNVVHVDKKDVENDDINEYINDNGKNKKNIKNNDKIKKDPFLGSFFSRMSRALTQSPTSLFPSSSLSNPLSKTTQKSSHSFRNTNSNLTDNISRRKNTHTENVVNRLRVLLVEDSLSVQKIFGSWLRANECEVMGALNGKLGLKCMKTKHFDVCFVDFITPVMSGVATIVEYHLWKNNPNTVLTTHQVEMQKANCDMMIIGMSHTTTDEEMNTAFSHGMHCFLPKPIDTDLLTSILTSKKKSKNLDLDLVDGVITPKKMMSPSRKTAKSNNDFDSYESECVSRDGEELGSPVTDEFDTKNIAQLVGVKLIRRMSTNYSDQPICSPSP